MADLSNYSITFDLEPIVKLVCLNTACKNHLQWFGAAACNLKQISIDEDGRCRDFERIDERPQAEAER